ncbi:SurA N-terminal domain-containing protein [Mesonia sediminis]|uniref:Periplasmic chaperone PpiD n=1 Tax=Mesonia sediminis TaxID=1703946 RepID=A0ABW5SFY5_9FLAO
MAVLNKIRQRSVFLIIIIALALFSFVLADLFRSGGFSGAKDQNIIGVVNGEEISREAFARQVEGVQRNSRGNLTTAQAVKQVWENQVNQTLLSEQLEKLGLQVGNDQINNSIKQQFAGNPNFTNENGQFDFGKMKEYIANLKANSPEAYQQWVSIENNIAQQAKAQLYYNLVRAGVGATLVEGEQAYKKQNDQVNLNFVQIPYEKAGEVEVSKEDIKAYLQDNKKKYTTEASRAIQYVYFEEKPSQADDEETKQELMSLLEDRKIYNEVSKMEEEIKGLKNTSDYQEFINENSDLAYEDRFSFKDELPTAFADALMSTEIGSIYGPYKHNNFWKASKVVESKQMTDSVKAKHILVAYSGTAVGQDIERTKEEAKKLADSLSAELKSNQDLFKEFAQEFSADASTKDKEGDLGWVNYRNTNSSDFIDYLFADSSPSLGVTETEFGYHVVLIEEKKAPIKAIKIATVAKEIEPSEKTGNDLFAETTKFEIAAGESDFQEVAKSNTYEVKDINGIKEMDEALGGLGNQRAIVQWAFNEDTAVNDIKRFDVPTGYVVAQLTQKHDKGLMAVEEASEEVTPIIKKEKQAKILLDKIGSFESLQDLASSQQVGVKNANAVNLENPVLPGAGSEPQVVGAAFFLPEGKPSAPIKGEKGIYVVEVTGRTAATPLDSYRLIAERESKERANQATNALMKALKNSAEIEDKRAKFY